MKSYLSDMSSTSNADSDVDISETLLAESEKRLLKSDICSLFKGYETNASIKTIDATMTDK